MIKKSILISEDCHYKIKKMALEKKAKISELLEKLIIKEFNKESPQCNNSMNI